MKKLILLSLLSLFLMNISVAAEGGEDRKAQSGHTITIIMEDCTFTVPLTHTKDLKDLEGFVTKPRQVGQQVVCIKFSTDIQMGPLFNHKRLIKTNSMLHNFSPEDTNFITFTPVQLLQLPTDEYHTLSSETGYLQLVCSVVKEDGEIQKSQCTETGLGIIKFFTLGRLKERFFPERRINFFRPDQLKEKLPPERELTAVNVATKYLTINKFKLERYKAIMKQID